MKRIVSVLMILVLLFAFVACKSEPGGKTGGGNGEMSPAEQAILNKYGEDIFYFAELADMAASVGEPLEEICGAASDSARTAIVSQYSAFGIQISNTSATTASFSWTEDGITVTIDVSNVSIVPSKGLNDSISYDAAVAVSGKENHSATVSLELDLVNNTTTITKGKYKTITFGTGSQSLQQANQCLQEIQALDDEGNGSGNNGGQNPYNPGQGQGGSQEPGQTEQWTDGTASLTKTASQILTALEGMNFEVTIRKAMGMEGMNYWFVYGRLNDNQVWAKRYDEYPAQFQQEPQYDMIAMDCIPEHQFQGMYDDKISDYIYYESDAYSDAWTTADTAVYHDDDGSRNWHEAVVFWLYEGEDIFDPDYSTEYPYADYLGGEFEHYALMLKPYTPYNLQLANGKYKVRDGKATVAGLSCTVYQYQQYYYYISDLYGICMKETYIDANKGEVATWEVTKFTTSPVWPVE